MEELFEKRFEFNDVHYKDVRFTFAYLTVDSGVRLYVYDNCILICQSDETGNLTKKVAFFNWINFKSR